VGRACREWGSAPSPGMRGATGAEVQVKLVTLAARGGLGNQHRRKRCPRLEIMAGVVGAFD